MAESALEWEFAPPSGSVSAPSSASVVWMNLLRTIHTHGSMVSPRGLETREVLANTVHVDMSRPVVLNKARNIGYKTMLGEAAWILSGDNTTEGIVPYCKRMSEFSDDGNVLRGAYGPQVIDQACHVTESLKNDEMSRQAVITTWRPNPPKSKDTPCTVSLQWMIRGRGLHCFVTMRSQDAYLGFPYDVFTFTMITGLVFLRLGRRDLRLGTLHLHAASHHYYMNNLLKIDEIRTKRECHDEIVFDPSEFETSHHLLKQLRIARDWPVGGAVDGKSKFIKAMAEMQQNRREQ